MKKFVSVVAVLLVFLGVVGTVQAGRMSRLRIRLYEAGQRWMNQIQLKDIKAGESTEVFAQIRNYERKPVTVTLSFVDWFPNKRYTKYTSCNLNGDHNDEFSQRSYFDKSKNGKRGNAYGHDKNGNPGNHYGRDEDGYGTMTFTIPAKKTVIKKIDVSFLSSDGGDIRGCLITEEKPADFVKGKLNVRMRRANVIKANVETVEDTCNNGNGNGHGNGNCKDKDDNNDN